MIDQELREHIQKSLSNRYTPISSTAVLTGIPYGPDYDRGKELLWNMVEEGLIEQTHFSMGAKMGSGIVNLYKWVE